MNAAILSMDSLILFVTDAILARCGQRGRSENRERAMDASTWRIVCFSEILSTNCFTVTSAIVPGSVLGLRRTTLF
jgi:hypothetical protein